MARVFLSFAGPDLDRATEVFGWLRNDGHDVFLYRDAHQGTEAGEGWKRRLYQELNQVDAVVCLVSPDYLRSLWCTAEVAIADSRGCKLVPLCLEPGLTHSLIEDKYHISVDGTDSRERTLAVLRKLDANGRTVWRDGENPYPGLAPFTTKLSGLYFGRAQESRELSARMRAGGPGRVVAIAGASGCGKSSLLQAGLIPQLADDEEWIVVEPWSPGDDPVYALSKALTRTARQLGLTWSLPNVERELRDEGGLRKVADMLLIAKPRARWVLLPIDQAEDLFAPGTREQSRTDLARTLVTSESVRPVLTVRSEYLDDLGDLLSGAVDPYLLGPLDRSRLRSAIESPARIAGLRPEPELSQRLLDDTDTSDALPLLAFTLRQLADSCSRGDVLTLAAYESLGGLHRILADRADEALREAEKTSGLSREVVVSGLVRLVSEDDTGRRTRRWVDPTRLTGPMNTALSQFVEHRLLVTDGHGQLRFAHDALLTAWPTLSAAIELHATTVRATRLVEQAAADWTGANRAEGYLWDSKRYTAIMGDLTGAPHDGSSAATDLDQNAQAFLDATRARLDRTVRQQRRRRARTVSILSALLAIASVAGILAVIQAGVAQDERDAATVRELVARAEAVREEDPQLALRFGLAAEALGSTPQTRAGLQETLTMNDYAATLRGHHSSVFDVAFSPDGHVLASVDGDDHTVRLWDVSNPMRPRALGKPLTDHSSWVLAAAFSPTTEVLATVGRGQLILWAVDDPAAPTKLATVDSAATDHSDGIGLAFTPDGRVLATTNGGRTQLFDVTDPATPRPLGPPLIDHNAFLSDVVFSADGGLLAVAASYRQDQEDAVSLWRVTDPAAPTLVGTLSLSGVPVSALAFAPGRPILAVAQGDISDSEGTVSLWDVSSPADPAMVTRLTDHRSGARDAAFDATGGMLATTGNDGTVRTYDISEPGRPRAIGAPRTDHTNAVYAVAFSPDGVIATGSADNTVILWAGTNPAQPVERPMSGLGHAEEVTALAFNAGGTLLATSARAGPTRIWDVRDPNRVQGPGLVSSPHGPLTALAFHPTEPMLATGSGSARGEFANAREAVTLWDVREPTEPRVLGKPLLAHNDEVISLHFPPGNGSTLWSADSNVVLTRWDITDPASPKQVAVAMRGRLDWQGSISFRPDSELIATATDGVKLRDISDPANVRLLGGTLSDDSATSAVFGQDGDLLVTGGNDVFLWDVSTPWQPVQHGPPLGRV